MPHIPLLDEVALIAALGVAVTLVLSRLRLPAVAGLLLTGALLGPAGLGLVKSLEAIEVLAEVGVVLLLFTIGLEFSLARLTAIFKQVAAGGLLQVGLTIGAVTGLSVAWGWPPGRALFLGFVFALSSTAIVLRALTERRELDAPHGRFIVGTLIFQDLCVVPMVLVVPLLGATAGGGNVWLSVGIALGKAAAVVVVAIALARVLVPKLLAWVDASRSREVFLLAVLALCMGTAWATGLAGLSLALGAFLGGMAIADTEYGHRAMSEVMPLRDAFVSVFFVSLGMFFDLDVVLAQPVLVVVLTVGFVFGKGFLATAAAMVMRFPSRVAWLAGVGLAQFGEFGFVLARLGQSSGVIDAQGVAPILSAGIVSMFLTPLLVRMAPNVRAGERLLLPLERLLGARSIDEEDAEHPETLSEHVVVVGYGLAGQTITRALKTCGQRYVVLELNAETVRAARGRGEPVFYGDATSPEALEHAHLAQAKVVLLVLNDPPAAQRIVDVVKRVAPHVPVMMRARYLKEADALKAQGAQDVVAEEVEGGLELLVRVLRVLQQPRNVIDARVKEAREATHTSERKPTYPRPTLGEVSVLAGLKVESVRVEATSGAVGKSAVELDLRRRTGALVVAVARDGGLLQAYSPAAPFLAGDVVFLAGDGESLRRASATLG
ncbi:MAG: sodium:proton exchanger [Archangiaceae bacterium]|nr:sodium:proton exchanger [Archangiaceae bacterium]